MKNSVDVDYVIVGAGSAGCVLANRLTETGSDTVAILEAGPMDRNLMIHIPAGVYSVYRDPKINWNYVTETEPELHDRRVDMPRGKVVGGSSSINSMVYMRGHPHDYDSWAADFGLDQWSFDQCLPYFRRSESSERGDSEWHGAEGPLSVSRASLKNPLLDVFLEAGQQAGQGHTDDPNGYNPEGVARLDSTKRNGRRCSAAVAYLRPALRRSNLTLVTHAFAQRILFDGDRAIGVEYSHKGKTQRVMARKEVILSGGAINSPQLLMLSGVGPADQLRDHGINLQLDLPGVGQNLQDHPCFIMKYQCTKPVTIHKATRPINKLMVGTQWLVNQTGLAASNIYEAGGCIRGNEEVAYGNLQYHFAPFGAEYQGNSIKLDQAFSVHVDLLRPESVGHLQLTSASITDKPLTHFNYLATAGDQQQMIEAVRKVRDLVGQSAFDEFRGRALTPAHNVHSDAEILDWLRGSIETDYHPCGTCRMGNDALAVVDGEMRVHGLQGLRVVDASVLPKIVSGNLNAPTQMIGERAADFIRGLPQMTPETARFNFRAQ